MAKAGVLSPDVHIHLLSQAYLGSDLGGSREFHLPRHPTPQQHFPGAPGGDPKAFTGQMGYIIPPPSSGSTSGSPPSWMRLEDLQREMSRRHPSLVPFKVKEKQLCSH